MRTRNIVGCILLLLLMASAVVGVYSYALRTKCFASEPGDFGTFGSYIGGTFGALTGLISVFFLYITYRKQMDMYEEQQKQAYHQQFESNFFEMLSFFRSTVPSEPDKKDNEKLFADVHSTLKSAIDKMFNGVDDKYISDENSLIIKKNIQKAYYLVFTTHSSSLGHYFRSLYHLLTYIDTHCKKEKKMYFDMVQAQMNTDELYVTCINGISNYGREKLLPILNSSSFLENLPILYADDKYLKALVYQFYPDTKRKSLDNLKHNVILLAGTEGVQKGTIHRKIMSQVPSIRNLSFDGLVRQIIKPVDGKYDIVLNKDKMIERLRKTIDPDYTYLISCSFLQLSSNGDYTKLPQDLFDELNISGIVLIKGQTEYVRQSIGREEGVQYDRNMTDDYMDAHDKYVYNYAHSKRIPVYEQPFLQHDAIVQTIKNIMAK